MGAGGGGQGFWMRLGWEGRMRRERGRVRAEGEGTEEDGKERVALRMNASIQRR